MPRRNGTGPFGTFKDCVNPEDGLRRPLRIGFGLVPEYDLRRSFGVRLGRGRRLGRRGRRDRW
jgi:hypothetical protein